MQQIDASKLARRTLRRTRRPAQSRQPCKRPAGGIELAARAPMHGTSLNPFILTLCRKTFRRNFPAACFQRRLSGERGPRAAFPWPAGYAASAGIAWFALAKGHRSESFSDRSRVRLTRWRPRQWLARTAGCGLFCRWTRPPRAATLPSGYCLADCSRCRASKGGPNEPS